MENPSINDAIPLSQEESQHLPTISKEPIEFKNKEQWDPRSIHILLNKYEEIFVRLDRGHLRVDWKLLALMVNVELGTQWTIYQCKSKMEYMRKKFRREKLKLKRTGSFPSWPYFNRMSQILGSVPENEIGMGAHCDESCPAAEPNGQFASHPQIQVTDTTDENEAISLPRAQAASVPDVAGKPAKKRKCFESLNLVREFNDGLALFASVMERIQKMKMEMTLTLEREYMDREERHIQLIMQQEERQTKMLLQTQLQIATLFARSKGRTVEQNPDREQQNKDGKCHQRKDFSEVHQRLQLCGLHFWMYPFRFISVSEALHYLPNDGFPCLGVLLQKLENPALRACLNVKSNEGVLVRKIEPTSHAKDVLKEGDVITSFDGVPVANEGTVPFRSSERIAFGFLISKKFTGDTAVLGIIRGGKKMEVQTILKPRVHLVPYHIEGGQPSYLIVSGLVFTPLSEALIDDECDESMGLKLLAKARYSLPQFEGEQIVILSQVLANDVNIGYEDMSNQQALKLNGIKIKNIRHLAHLVDSSKDTYLIFEFEDNLLVVLERKAASIAAPQILKDYGIPCERSPDLSEPYEDLSGNNHPVIEDLANGPVMNSEIDFNGLVWA